MAAAGRIIDILEAAGFRRHGLRRRRHEPRTHPDPHATAVGTWRVGDVAAHLSHVFRVDADAVAERPVPRVEVTTAGVAALTDSMLAEDDQRDPVILADRIEALGTDFDDIVERCDADTVVWLGDTRLAPSAVACHLLEECLVHGHDIATGTGRSWPIDRRHALLVIEGGVLPLITALPPTAWVRQDRAASLRARVELRLRGGGRTVLALENGGITVRPGQGQTVDVRVSADPAALMLLFMGREGVLKPMLTGKGVAWGRRPWKLLQVLGAVSPP